MAYRGSLIGDAHQWQSIGEQLGARAWQIDLSEEGDHMPTVNLDDAGAHLREIIAGLNPGDQLVIVQDGETIATLTRSRPEQRPCKAGSAKETAHGMAPDFDAPLEDFREYME